MMVLGATKHDDRVVLRVEEDGHERSIVISIEGSAPLQVMRWPENERHLEMMDVGFGLRQIARRVWNDKPVEYPLEARFRIEWHFGDAL